MLVGIVWTLWRQPIFSQFSPFSPSFLTLPTQYKIDEIAKKIRIENKNCEIKRKKEVFEWKDEKEMILSTTITTICNKYFVLHSYTV